MALKIIKITKGYGRKIASTVSYGFWDFPPTTLEAEIVLDLDKEEDKQKLKEVSARLFKAAKALVNADIKATKEKDPELVATLNKIQEKVNGNSR